MKRILILCLLLCACGGSDADTEVLYGTVVSAEGRVWLDRNLGADPDTDPSEYTGHDDERGFGDLYQWGRGTDGHQSRESEMTFVLSDTDTPNHSAYIPSQNFPYDWRSPQNDNLWHDGVNNPCPDGFRIPTEEEWAVEIASWDQPGYIGAFNSPLKLTAAGYRGMSDGKTFSNGAIWVVGRYGEYWSSGIDSDGRSARYLNFSDSYTGMSKNYRECGLSVRCIRE